MPSPLIINTLADMLAVLLFETCCIFLYDSLYPLQFMSLESVILCQIHFWLQPELGFKVITKNMNMHSQLLIGENLEGITAFAMKYGTHG